MKNVLFVASHLFSGSDDLIAVLNENERIQIHNTSLEYNHPVVLESLYSLGHKVNNTAAIYGDHILFNMQFGNAVFYDFTKFIYVIRAAKPTLNEIIKYKKEYSELTACRYYCFRLRRIYEMARKTPGAVLLTGEDLRNREGADLIFDYLNLNKLPNLSNLLYLESQEDKVTSAIVAEAQDCYEKHLYRLKQLNLRKT